MFKNIKRYALLLRNPTLKQCSNIKCAKIHKIVKNSRKLSCECGAITCLKCGLKYHRRKTCDKANDDLLKEYCKRTDTLPCPKCGILCQKAGGCKHMSCLICAYEWCFYCHGKYTQKHICAMNQSTITYPNRNNIILWLKQIVIIIFGLPFFILYFTIAWPLYIFDFLEEYKDSIWAFILLIFGFPITFLFLLSMIALFPLIWICYGICFLANQDDQLVIKKIPLLRVS